MSQQLKLLRKFINECIQSSVISEDEKPGGGLTWIGAGMVTDETGTKAEIRKALAKTGGNVKRAAKSLDASTRNLYRIIDQDKTGNLENAKERFQNEKEKKDNPESVNENKDERGEKE